MSQEDYQSSGAAPIANKKIGWTPFGQAGDLITGDVNATGLKGAIGSADMEEMLKSSSIEWQAENADSLFSSLNESGGALEMNLFDIFDQNMSPAGIKRQFQRFEGIFKQMQISKLSVGDQLNLSTGLTGTSQSKYTGRNAGG